MPCRFMAVLNHVAHVLSRLVNSSTIPRLVGHFSEALCLKQPVLALSTVSKAFDQETILDNVSLTVEAGEFITILGPSGCGKTTLLRLVAGFEQPTQGDIVIEGRVVNTVAPHKRRVNTVFQSYALFPHMTVYDNVAFGLSCKNVPRNEIDRRVMDALKSVRLDHFATRKPDQLSGGQQQRVAIARAVVNEPLVLLLDEPLSALDYRLRLDMQLELKRLQRQLGITFILVTHDQEEALSISDRVVVMHDGLVQQVGTPRQIYETPANLQVARFVGAANIFEATIEGIVDQQLDVSFAGRSYRLKNKRSLALQTGQAISVLIRPEDFSVWDRTEVDSEEKAHMIPAVVEDVIYKGSTVDLRLRTESGELIQASEFFDEDDEELNYRVGEPVWAEFQLGWEEILLS